MRHMLALPDTRIEFWCTLVASIHRVSQVHTSIPLFLAVDPTFGSLVSSLVVHDNLMPSFDHCAGDPEVSFPDISDPSPKSPNPLLRQGAGEVHDPSRREALLKGRGLRKGRGASRLKGEGLLQG